jgi:ribonuclease P protein component
MQRSQRLTSAGDVRRVRRTGRSFSHALAVLLVRPNGLEKTRFGVTAGHALSGAVRRNRAKRRLREVLPGFAARARGGWDVVLIARPASLEAEFPELERAVAGLLERSGVLPKRGRHRPS